MSENSDIFQVEVDPAKDFMTEEDLVLERIDRLAALLRDRPLLPLNPRCPPQAYEDVSSGVRFPLLHCGFKDCKWTKDAKDAKDPILLHWGQEWALFVHLVTEHREAFTVHPSGIDDLSFDCVFPLKHPH